MDAYARYTEQLWCVYAALEEDVARPAQDQVAGPFVRPELLRLPELERDLAHLRGAGRRERGSALPATAAYAARIRECARSWPAGGHRRGAPPRTPLLDRRRGCSGRPEGLTPEAGEFWSEQGS